MNFLSATAIYQQIGDYVCENILLGKWAEGSKIPSIRDLAVAIEVNPNTVLRSYNYLQEKEIIQNQRGLGYFVAEKGYEKTKRHLTDGFVNTELPRIFKTMDLLKFSCDDLKPYHAEYQKTHKN
jgi:GntR family transcriptional regulator